MQSNGPRSYPNIIPRQNELSNSVDRKIIGCESSLVRISIRPDNGG